MNRKVFQIVRWAYSFVLVLALIGFAWRGVLPETAGAYAAMSPAEGHFFRALTWTGFAVTFGFLLLPWWPWRWATSD